MGAGVSDAQGTPAWRIQDSRGQILALAFRHESLKWFKLIPLRLTAPSELFFLCHVRVPVAILGLTTTHANIARRTDTGSVIFLNPTQVPLGNVKPATET